MTSFETLIGLRYLRAKRRNSFISFISLISIVGIALGVAALIIVLSVMNGFQKEIRGRILGVASHLEISGMNNRLDNWRGAMAVARQDARVTASAPFVSAQGLLSVGPNVRGAMVRDVLQKDRDGLEAFQRFNQHLARHEIDLKKTQAALGPWLTLDSKTERFVGSLAEEANQLVKRHYREPFVIREEV